MICNAAGRASAGAGAGGLRVDLGSGEILKVPLPELLSGESRRREGLDDATRRALQWFVMPVWIGAGLADWWCHRRTDIERTAGTRESAIHAR